MSDLNDFWCRAVHEFGAELDGYRRAFIADGVNTAADSIARLEYRGGQACFSKLVRRREPRHARANDDDVNSLGHVVVNDARSGRVAASRE